MTAKGSHTTYGGWEKRSCDRCGKRVTLKDQGAMYHYDHTTQQVTTICVDCLHKCPWNAIHA